METFISDVLSPAEFWCKAKSLTVIDVRSPGEFSNGHIPGAKNIPLLNDEERAAVGITYKNQGRVAAVQLGIGLVSPRLPQMIAEAMSLTQNEQVLVHCWRGGMRSRSFADFLKMVDLNPQTLDGGYKGFRRMAHNHFETPLRMFVISGLTGVGKTRVLQLLADAGEQVIDLEELAQHRGSSFGGIGMTRQPTTEQFENELFRKLDELDLGQRIWVEDEGQRIGKVTVPPAFFQQLRYAPAVFIESSRSSRIENLMRDYGSLPPEELIAAVDRIAKRLDGKQAKLAVTSIDGGHYPLAIEIVLDYYDKTYQRAKAKIPRSRFEPLSIEGKGDSQIVTELMAFREN